MLPACHSAMSTANTMSRSIYLLQRMAGFLMEAGRREEQLLERHLLGDQILLVEIGDKCLEGRPVRLNAVGRGSVAEHRVDLVEVGAEPWQHVAQRPGVVHLRQRAELQLAQCI